LVGSPNVCFVLLPSYFVKLIVLIDVGLWAVLFGAYEVLLVEVTHGVRLLLRTKLIPGLAQLELYRFFYSLRRLAAFAILKLVIDAVSVPRIVAFNAPFVSLCYNALQT
jgi:hypothetical protein